MPIREVVVSRRRPHWHRLLCGLLVETRSLGSAEEEREQVSYGSSRQEKIRELPGLITAASGSLVRAKVAEAEAQRVLDAAVATSAREAERFVILVNELKDLALAPPEKESVSDD